MASMKHGDGSRAVRAVCTGVGGHVPYEELPAHYASMQSYLLPIWSEGWVRSQSFNREEEASKERYGT